MPSNIDELVAAIVNYTDAAKENEFLNAIIETDPGAAYHDTLSVASVKKPNSTDSVRGDSY